MDKERDVKSKIESINNVLRKKEEINENLRKLNREVQEDISMIENSKQYRDYAKIMVKDIEQLFREEAFEV